MGLCAGMIGAMLAIGHFNQAGGCISFFHATTQEWTPVPNTCAVMARIDPNSGSGVISFGLDAATAINPKSARFFPISDNCPPPSS